MSSDRDLEEVEENLRVLIREELETQHRIDGHPTPVDECPVCQAHRLPAA